MPMKSREEIIQAIGTLTFPALSPLLVNDADITKVRTYLNTLYQGDHAITDEAPTETNFSEAAASNAIRDAIIAKRTALLVTKIQNEANLTNLPVLKDNATGQNLKNYFVNLRTTDSSYIEVDSALPDDQRQDIVNAIITRRTGLLAAKIREEKTLANLPVLENNADSNQVREYVERLRNTNTATYGGIDLNEPHALPNNQTDAIRDAIIARRAALLAEQITKETNLSRLPILRANADGNVVRAYVNTLRRKSGTTYGAADVNERSLPDGAGITAIRDAVIARRTALLVDKIGKETDLSHLPILKDNAGAAKVRAYIETLRQTNTATYGTDGVNDAQALPNNQTDAIRNAIIARRTTLLAEQIAKETDLTHLPALEENVTNGDFLRYFNTLRGTNLATYGAVEVDLNSLPELAINTIKPVIIARRTDLLIAALQTDNHLDSFPPLDDDVRTYVETLRRTNEGKYGRIALNEQNLPTAQLATLKKEIIAHRTALLVEAIGSDPNAAHFEDDLTSTAPADIRAHFNRLRAEDEGSYGPEVDENTLPDSELDAIKTAISQRRDHFATESIQRSIDQISPYPHASHPALMEVIHQLSTEQRVTLRDNPPLLRRLMSARTGHDLASAARDCGINQETLSPTASTPPFISLDKLLHENQQCRELQFLLSPSLAEACLRERVTLTSDDTSKCNEKILADYSTDELGADDYPGFVDALLTEATLSHGDKQRVYDALISQQDVVIQQHNFNLPLYNKLQQASTTSPKDFGKIAALNVLITIEKQNNALADDDITALVDAIKKAKTYAELTTAFGKEPLLTFVADGGGQRLKNWQKTLTREQFEAIKHLEKRTSILNGNMDVMTTQEKAMSQMQASLTQLSEATYDDPSKQTKLRSELKRLKDLDAEAWLSPDVQIIASQHALELLDEFELLDKLCDTTCRALKEQQRLYLDMLRQLPTPKQITDLPDDNHNKVALRIHQENVNAELKKIKALLGDYQALQRRLRGDPRAETASKAERMGILPMMREAKGLGVKATDRSLSEKAKYLEDAKKASASTSTTPTAIAATVTVNEDEVVFRSTGALKEGTFRIHQGKDVELPLSSPTDPKIILGGHHIEERGKPRIETRKNGTKDIIQPTTITIARWPTANVAVNQLNPKQKQMLELEQVKYATDIAFDILSKIGTVVPTAKRPIRISGESKEEVGMIYTALVMLSKTHPKFKFRDDAIKVDSFAFDPVKDKKDKEVYTARFKDDRTGKPLQTMCETMRAFYERKLAGGVAQTVSKDVTSFYRQAMTTGAKEKIAYDAMKAQAAAAPTDEDDTTFRPPGARGG